MTSPSSGHLNDALVRQILDEQRQGWPQGSPLPVEAYLEQHPQLGERSEDVLLLICNEIVLRKKCGETPQLEEYQKRFPHLAQVLEKAFQAPFDELTHRVQAGAEILAEYLEFKIPFDELIRRVRKKDPVATTQLVKDYAPKLIRSLKVRFLNKELRRRTGVSDIVQSACRTFIKRVRDGQFQLEKPQDLVNLLLRIAHNKLGKEKRKLPEKKGPEDPEEKHQLPSQSPIEIYQQLKGQQEYDGKILEEIEMQELVEKARSLMSDEERQLCDLWMQGNRWQQIAEAMGGTPEARRKQWDRVLERIKATLNAEQR